LEVFYFLQLWCLPASPIIRYWLIAILYTLNHTFEPLGLCCCIVVVHIIGQEKHILIAWLYQQRLSLSASCLNAVISVRYHYFLMTRMPVRKIEVVGGRGHHHHLIPRTAITHRYCPATTFFIGELGDCSMRFLFLYYCQIVLLGLVSLPLSCTSPMMRTTRMY
jgi:hypothetical protein